MSKEGDIPKSDFNKRLRYPVEALRRETSYPVGNTVTGTESLIPGQNPHVISRSLVVSASDTDTPYSPDLPMSERTPANRELDFRLQEIRIVYDYSQVMEDGFPTIKLEQADLQTPLFHGTRDAALDRGLMLDKSNRDAKEKREGFMERMYSEDVYRGNIGDIVMGMEDPEHNEQKETIDERITRIARDLLEQEQVEITPQVLNARREKVEGEMRSGRKVWEKTMKRFAKTRLQRLDHKPTAIERIEEGVHAEDAILSVLRQVTGKAVIHTEDIDEAYYLALVENPFELVENIRYVRDKFPDINFLDVTNHALEYISQQGREDELEPKKDASDPLREGISVSFDPQDTSDHREPGQRQVYEDIDEQDERDHRGRDGR